MIKKILITLALTCFFVTAAFGGKTTRSSTKPHRINSSYVKDITQNPNITNKIKIETLTLWVEELKQRVSDLEAKIDSGEITGANRLSFQTKIAKQICEAAREARSLENLAVAHVFATTAQSIAGEMQFYCF